MYCKSRIRKKFSSAAAHYDLHAALQKKTVSDLLTFSREYLHAEKNILDLGAGTGFIAHALPAHAVVNVDIAWGMLNYIQNTQGTSCCICADADRLPLKDEVFPLIMSSLMLQWSLNLEKTLAEVYRVLAQGGVFVFATLGINTLWQLRQCWQQVAREEAIHTFVTYDAMHTILCQQFKEVVLQEKNTTFYYPDAMQVMLHLKQLGVTNSHLKQRKGLLGKRALQQVISYYEQFRTAAGLPLHYQVFLGVVRK